MSVSFRSFYRLGSAAALALTLAACNTSAQASATDDIIEVSGQGVVYAVPDTMRVTMTVVAEGDKLSPLKTKVDQITATVLRDLQQRDIEREDIRSFQLSIQPRYERQQNETRQNGFQVSRQIAVTLRDTENFDHIIDFALAQGVTRVGNIQYVVDDSRELAQQALLAAIDDAHEKAALMASHSNRELGGIVTIRESYSSGGIALRAMAADSASINVSEPGQQSIDARVEVVFRLR